MFLRVTTTSQAEEVKEFLLIIPRLKSTLGTLLLLCTSIPLLHHTLTPNRLSSQLLCLAIPLAARVPPLARGLHVRHAVRLGLLP